MIPTWVRWRFGTCLNLPSSILGGNLLVDKTNLPLAAPIALLADPAPLERFLGVTGR
jgi:hypothetical protein